MTYTQKKPSILKWRVNHKEHYNEYMNDYQKMFYQDNKEKICKRKANYYLYKKECKRLLNIFEAFL